jgi:Fe-S-cluster-containing dehydrogenase component
MKKKIFVVADELCSGCRSCEMWCSFIKNRGDEFNSTFSFIKIIKDAEGTLNKPIVDCNAQGCPSNEEGEPICVEMCPTGTLVYTDLEDLYQKRIELERKRNLQPLFRLIAPWKYPYPWREWSKEDF